MNNRKVLENGFKKGFEIIEEHIYKQLLMVCNEIYDDIDLQKGFMGFTGNTQTSYMIGIYVNGKLRNIRYQDKWLAPVKRRKLSFPEPPVYLDNPYEGPARKAYAKVPTNGKFGAQTSLNFLRSYHPRNKGVSIVVTTGTEYSTYLENNVGNVLTATYENAKQILLSGIKPINAM